METNELASIVEQAKAHDNIGITRLYEEYHNSVYFLCLKIVKNQDDALDLVQDSFLQAFDRLNTLQNPAQFGSWLNQIAANKCRDFLKKKKPLLFSDKTDENEDSEEFVIENKDESLIPDKVVDNAETRRLVMEIIDNLPDLQRMTIMLYYYEEKSVAQIAEIMECSENTVKSRLNYARKQIKEQVLALEKNGTKLYVVMPMLFPLIHNAAADFAMPSSASSALLGNITSSVAANTVGAASSSATASQAVSAGAETTGNSARVITAIHKVTAGFLKFSLPAKIGVCAAAVAVVAGVGLGVAAASHHNIPVQTTMASLTSSMSSSSSESTTLVMSDTKTVSSEISSKQEESSSFAPTTIAVTGISLSKTKLSLTVGEKTMPIVTMTPKNATDKGEIWSSSDSKIATVDQSGNIKAVGAGSCTITVTSASNKSVVSKVNVTVTKVSTVNNNSKSANIDTTKHPIFGYEVIGEGISQNGNTVTIQFNQQTHDPLQLDCGFCLWKSDTTNSAGENHMLITSVQFDDTSIAKAGGRSGAAYFHVIKCGTTKATLSSPDDPVTMTITIKVV